MDQDTAEAITKVSKAFGITETDEKSAEVFNALLTRLKESADSADITSFDAVLDILAQIEHEIQLNFPNAAALIELNTQVHRIMAARFLQAARDISQSGKSDIFGADANEQTAKLQSAAKRIEELSAKKVAQINALTAFVLAANRKAGSVPPVVPPVDSGDWGGDDGDMLKRIEKLETDVAAIKIDVAVVKANGATKSDVAELKGMFGELRASTKADIADAKTAIIVWIVGVILLAQVLPAILKVIPELTSMLGR